MKIDWIERGVLAASASPTSAQDIESLHEQGIRAIVTLRERSLTALRDITPKLLQKLDIQYLHVPVVDFEPPDEQQVLDVKIFIDEMRARRKPVYLHCYAGIGRTGTLLHGYYLLKGMSLEEAKAKVLATRPAACFDELSDTQRAFLYDLERTLGSSIRNSS
jgi:atypical dual specificity phosphatase